MAVSPNIAVVSHDPPTFAGLSPCLSQFQWVIYDCETRDVQLLEEFSPRPFFLKMYLPYFDMFAQGQPKRAAGFLCSPSWVFAYMSVHTARGYVCTLCRAVFCVPEF